MTTAVLAANGLDSGASPQSTVNSVASGILARDSRVGFVLIEVPRRQEPGDKQSPLHSNQMNAVDGDFIPLDNGTENSDDDVEGFRRRAFAAPHSTFSAGFGGGPFLASPATRPPPPKRKAELMLDDAMMDVEGGSSNEADEDETASRTPPSDLYSASPGMDVWASGGMQTNNGHRASKAQRLASGLRWRDGSDGPHGDPGETSALRARVAELESMLVAQRSDHAENTLVAQQNYSRMETQTLVELQRWQSRAAELEERLGRSEASVRGLQAENERLREELKRTTRESTQRAEYLKSELELVLSKSREPYQVNFYSKLAENDSFRLILPWHRY